MAAKGAKRKKGSWGGARPGAGRKKGSGKGPSEDARVWRVSVMLSASERAKLDRLADRKGLPAATLAYHLLAAALRRAR